MRHAKLNSALLLLLLNVFAPAALAGGGSQFSEAEQAIYKELLKLPYYGVFDHIRFQVVGGPDCAQRPGDSSDSEEISRASSERRRNRHGSREPD